MQLTPPHPLFRYGVIGIVLMAVFVFGRPMVQAQQAPFPAPDDFVIKERVPFEEVMSYDDVCDLDNNPVNMNTFVESKAAVPKSQQTEINVDYGPGFTNEAQEAFQRAADIWATYIDSSVPITIDASFQDLGQGVLASAGPRFLYTVELEDGQEVAFGDALINALTGQNQRPNDPEIIVNVNSERTDWHFGEGPPGPAEIDFTTVIMHEIGHGLNFINLTGVASGGQGHWGLGQGPNRPEDDKIPGVLEVLLQHEATPGTFNQLIDRETYPNPSINLGNALTSDALFAQGPNTDLAAENSTGPVPAKIYAPSSYQPGSSIAHFDQDTYTAPGGDPNALMRPQIGFNEVTRTPGPIFCGLLADMGWPLTQACDELIGAEVLDFAAATTSTRDEVTVQWTQSSQADDIDSYTLERCTYYDDVAGNGGEIKDRDRCFAENANGEDGFEDTGRTIQPQPGRAYNETFSDLELGNHVFRLSWERDGETRGGFTADGEVNVFVAEEDIEIDLRENQGRGDVTLSWQLPAHLQSESGFTFELERAVQPREDEEPVFSIENVKPDMDGPVSATTLRSRLQPAGEYQYRVRSITEEGDVLFSDAVDVEIPLDDTAALTGAYPNPTSGPIRLDLTTQNTQNVLVEVYDTIGRRVYRDQRRADGNQAQVIEIGAAEQWASGMYFVRVTGDDFSETRKVSLVR